MPLRDHWWCILVAIFGAFLFTEIGAVVITDYNELVCGLVIKKGSILLLGNAVNELLITTIRYFF